MTTTATKPATAKSTPKATPAKPAPKVAPAKATAPKEQPTKPEPTTLVEALTTEHAALLKVRGNGTKRSLPYLAVGTEQRKQSEAVAMMKADGQTVEAIAEALKVSNATARRCLTNLQNAQDVEVGKQRCLVDPGHQGGRHPHRAGQGVTSVPITIEQRGTGELSWAVLVNNKVAVQGLTRTDAARERLRLWHGAPEQRAAARERICGG